MYLDPSLHTYICYIYIVISWYENDIIVTTRQQGGAEVEFSNNDIIRLNGR